MSAPTTPQEIVERALALSKSDGCVVIAEERSETNLRWANNSLTTNGAMRSRRLTVISLVSGGTGVAAGVVGRSAVTADTLEDLVRASEQAARDAGPADDAAPLVEPSESGVDGSAGWSEPPEETSVQVFGELSPALGSAFNRFGDTGRRLFGFAEHAVETTYLGSSTGLRGRHVQPTGRIEINGKGAERGSVWLGRSTRDFADLDMAELEAELGRRLDWEARAIELPAGRYQTIVPPGAVADLVIPLYWSAGARDADEGRTVFSKAGGGTRIGERVAAVPLSLRSDPAAAGLECAPFTVATASFGGLTSVFDNGSPVHPTDWIRAGELASLIRTRAWAAKTDAEPTPAVDNLIMAGPDGPNAGRSIDEMVAATERGLLLTCMWYIRTVDPQTLLSTGLTRDGVYLVENGEVTGSVNNFRWNESPVDVLGRVAEVGRTERCLPREWSDYFTRTAMPALRVEDFNMSTVSQAS